MDGHARRARRAPVRMIRKRRCAAIGQGQMIVVQYPEGFETRGVALLNSNGWLLLYLGRLAAGA